MHNCMEIENSPQITLTIKNKNLPKPTHPKGSEKLRQIPGFPVEVEGPIGEHDQASHYGQAWDGEHQSWIVVIDLILSGQAKSQCPGAKRYKVFYICYSLLYHKRILTYENDKNAINILIYALTV